jgi:xanthine dehydrogenase small subunit
MKGGAHAPLRPLARKSKPMTEVSATRPIRFWHRGKVQEVPHAPATQSVLAWLREQQQLMGTKEGCAEGDCGACTVVLGELDAQQRLQLKPVNSCIQFLPTLDGKALFTVEDVAGSQQLHPVQEAMVACHGSQCGFCTPGFVMSLWQCWEQAPPASSPTRQQLADHLAGNLCRCTGYRPILDAAEQAFAQAAPKLDRAPIEAALRQLQDRPSLHTTSGFHAPRTLAELAQLRVELPTARLVAGATDVGLWVNKQFRELDGVIYLGQVQGLDAIVQDAQGLHIGATASLDAAWAALARWHPSLTEVWLRFASPPIRSVGTLGGNVANGSPIGDAAPVLMALDAEIELQHLSSTRRLPLAEFYVDYMKNQLQPGEFVRALHVPLREGWVVQVHKISKRFDSDISAVLGAFALKLDNGCVQDVRLAWGGLAGIVRRSPLAEAALRGKGWGPGEVQAAQAALPRDFTPLSDMRASSAYRLQVAQNLLQKLWLATRASAPLAAEQLSVWEAR